ncbi:MAG: S24 family peptidase [Patescibacteria group bacterium]
MSAFNHLSDKNSDTITLDDYLIPRKEASYLMRVKGNSMKDAGIIDGDMVIVERTDAARPGEIVVADIDGEHTLKYYREQHGRPFLEAANSHYSPMYPKDHLNVEGVVRSVIRKY